MLALGWWDSSVRCSRYRRSTFWVLRLQHTWSEESGITTNVSRKCDVDADLRRLNNMEKTVFGDSGTLINSNLRQNKIAWLELGHARHSQDECTPNRLDVDKRSEKAQVSWSASQVTSYCTRQLRHGGLEGHTYAVLCDKQLVRTSTQMANHL